MIVIRQAVTADHKLDRAGIEKVLAEGWAEAGDEWARRALPKHFKARAAVEYGYQARTPAYEAYKQRTRGHRRPLVLSGDLERSLKSGHRVQAKDRGSKRRGAVKIHLNGPFYLKVGRGKTLLEEIRAVSSADEKALAAVLDKVLQRKLNATGPTRAVGRSAV